MWSKTHLSRRRQVASVFLLATKFPSSSSSYHLLLSPCFSSRLRLRVGALSKKKKCFFFGFVLFSGYFLAKHSHAACFHKLKHQSVSSLQSACGLISKPTLKLSSGSLRALSVSRRWAWLRMCGGLRCVWELTPKQRFSPLLSATTRMYHHVTVQWIRLQCEHPDLTPHHIISHSSHRPPPGRDRLS